MALIGDLVWDVWNVNHIARHGVVPTEADEVCSNAVIIRQSYADRIVVIGPTNAGRMLTVILEPLDPDTKTNYVVTARPASRRERRLYREEIG